MTSNSVDVLVVGAGPAGISAALTLKRLGLSTVVVDKATFPRDKCCGDGLTTSTLRQLEDLGIDPRRLPSFTVVTQTAWRSPSGHVSELALPEEDGIRIAVAPRYELDALMVESAREAGIEVLEGHPVTDVNAQGRALSVTAGGKTVQTRYIIAADGMWSPVRKLVSTSATPPYLGNIHAFRQYFTNVTGPAAERLYVSFEKDILPGYLWSFPLGNGRANVGFGIERRSGRSAQWMKDAWADIVQRPHIREELGHQATPESPHKAWPIPAHIEIDLLTAAGDRVFFAGDAARAVDPLTGEGIGQAFETGRLAASAISSHGTANPSRAARVYKREVRRGLAFDNRVAQAIARLVRHERAAHAVIRLAPQLNRLDHYAIRWVFEDNPRAAALTPWRWPQRFGETHKPAFSGEAETKS